MNRALPEAWRWNELELDEIILSAIEPRRGMLRKRIDDPSGNA